MKLSMLSLINQASMTRNRILQDLGAVEDGKALLRIGGDPQDEAMHAVITPVIERELRGRLASIERDLEAYGVDIG